MFATKKQKRSTWQSRNLSGFTLVELLLVIAIISVLATMSLGVLRNAQDDAKAAATQARITQIESLFAIQLEDYEIRRLPISNRELAAYVRANMATDEDGRMKVFVQLQALRRQILMDIINSEIPRAFFNDSTNPGRYSLNTDVGGFPSTQRALGQDGGVGIGFTEWLDNNYQNPIVPDGPVLSERLSDLKTSGIKSFARLNDGDFDLPGEYLYAVLQRMDIDGTPAVELIGNAAVGNVDGDPYPELIDAWGEPLQLRIWQVDVKDSGEFTGEAGLYPDGVTPVIFEDVDTLDFDVIDEETSFPTGYVPLNPQVPRVVQQIRFQIVSTRIARQRGDTTDTVLDPRDLL